MPTRTEWFAERMVNNEVSFLFGSFLAGAVLAGLLTFLLLPLLGKRPPELAIADQSHNQSDSVSAVDFKGDGQAADASDNVAIEQGDTQDLVSGDSTTESPKIQGQENAADRPFEKTTEEPAPNDQTDSREVNEALKGTEIALTEPDIGTENQAGTIMSSTIDGALTEIVSAEEPKTDSGQPALEVAESKLDSNVDLTEFPFQRLGKQVSLPDSKNLISVKLGEVFISNRYLLGAELISPVGISPLNTLFEMERDPSDNQTWVISIARNPRDKRQPVAMFSREEDEIFFRWLPEASSYRQVGYLQNCMLKLFTPDASHWLQLRQSTRLSPLILTDENLVSEIEVDLDFLPNMDVLRIEVLQPSIEDIAIFPNTVDIVNNIPGRILLSKNDRDLSMKEDLRLRVWVNIKVELKKRTKIQAALVSLDSSGPIKSLDQLEMFFGNWQAKADYFEREHDRINGIAAPPGRAEEKKKYLSDLTRFAKQASEFREKYKEYKTSAKKMLNANYGVRIYATLDGHEIEIAKTAMNSD